jgi:uncharacterized membrane protein YraQ (UPF0718 family)
MDPVTALGHALWMAFTMFWEILWPLILGFGLSALVQAVISKSEMTRLLPNDSPRSLAIACGLGAASSSCSYAAVALARSIFRKGANFTAAMAFQLASTNLVAELTIIIIVLMGWQFAAAEFVGGPLMVVLMALLFRLFLSRKLVAEARTQADKGLKGKMEGHAEMDMSVTQGSFWQRITSKNGFTATSHYFVMDLLAVWKDIAGGLLIAGALAAWVPNDFWKEFFLVSHPVAARFGDRSSGRSSPSFRSFVPWATFRWPQCFGMAVSASVESSPFIYADLIVLPIIDIYRKYYGWKVAGLIVAVFYVAMALAALLIELLFDLLGLIPSQRSAQILETSISLNYTTGLNVIFLAIALLLVVRFLKTGGRKMLAHME